MDQDRDIARVPIQITNGCLVASIQVDLDEDVVAQFRRDLLERIHVSNAAGVVLDLSGLELMDAEDFEALRGCVQMAAVMGARTVLVGMRPGVVSALVDLDVDTDDIEATLDSEEAFRRLRPAEPAPAEADPDEAEAEPEETP